MSNTSTQFDDIGRALTGFAALRGRDALRARSLGLDVDRELFDWVTTQLPGRIALDSACRP